jgi:hypothetical protein
MNKRVVVVGDLHCGHVGGLTPPGWHFTKKRDKKLNELHVEQWKQFKSLAKKVRNFDGELIVVCNGDAIDGSSTKAIREAITSDRSSQIDMAQICLQQLAGDTYRFVEGTPFHTGKEESWEAELADKFDSDIKPERFLTVNGVTFYFRHKIGRSGIPHGRHTPVAKEHMLKELDTARGAAPSADIMCYSHVHYHVGTFGPGWISMTLPALQTISNYGGRECSGQIDWGLTYFDINTNGSFSWEADIRQITAAKKTAEVL